MIWQRIWQQFANLAKRPESPTGAVSHMGLYQTPSNQQIAPDWAPIRAPGAILARDQTREANMADALKVAEQLHKFIQAADKKSKQLPLQNYKQYQPAVTPPASILKIYEACLSKLTDEECAEFDRIVEKMFGAV
jgi:hypothetical protein